MKEHPANLAPLSAIEQERFDAQVKVIPPAELAKWKEMLSQLKPKAVGTRTLYRWVMCWNTPDYVHKLQRLSADRRP